MHLTIVEGDLLDQPADAIVNAWNQNAVPWWVLNPKGVSGAIKDRAGRGPFDELARMDRIPLGGAVVTSAGELPFKGIIHVAGIDLQWRASETSVRDSVRHALALAAELGYASVAFPLIGAGSGKADAATVERWMTEEFAASDYPGEIRLVRFRTGA